MTKRTQMRWGYVLLVILSAAVLAYRMAGTAGNPAWGWRHRGRFATYAAARNLPCNHRLSEEDLLIPADMPDAFRLYLPERRSLAGRYLTRSASPGQAVREEMLAWRPAIDPVEHARLVAIPMGEQPESLDWLDAGTAAAILINGQSVPAQTVFINCGNPADRKTCVATLVVPEKFELAGDAAKWRLVPASGTRGWNGCEVGLRAAPEQ